MLAIANRSKGVCKIYFFYEKRNREITPVTDSLVNDLAREKLDQIFRSGNYIPQRFIDNRSNVALYNPKGLIDQANALIIPEEGSAYDLDNRLNDLNGRAWTIFTCSWFIFNALPSDLKEERQVSASIADHPATYSPTMISNFIEFFTKSGMRVLDPFAGIGSTLVASKRTGRIGYGVELNPKYYELMKLRVPDFQENIFNTTSERIDELNLPSMDFSISSPPYWDVLKRSTRDFHETREERGRDKYYSEQELDVGNIENYEEFIIRTTGIYLKVLDLLKPGGYLVVIVKNVKKGGKLFPIAWDLARELAKFAVLKDEKIWIQDKVGLAPYGYPYSWVSNILHHYCLIFQKPPKQI